MTAYYVYAKPGNSDKISNATIQRSSLNFFQQKIISTFLGITFFSLLPKRPKFSELFVGITSARLPFKSKGLIYRYFVKGTYSSWLALSAGFTGIFFFSSRSTTPHGQCNLYNERGYVQLNPFAVCQKILKRNFPTNGKRPMWPTDPLHDCTSQHDRKISIANSSLFSFQINNCYVYCVYMKLHKRL